MTDYFHHAEQLLGLSSKTVIVTGGANGIGAETVRCCAAHGAKVVIADLPSSARAAEVLISSLSKHQVVFLPVNICSWDETRELFEQTIQKFGQVDIVAANAGIMESKNFFDFETDEDGELKEPIASYRVLDVNIKGIMNGFSQARFLLHANKPKCSDGFRGSVVLTCSTAGYFGGTGVISYVSSKHGVIGLLRSSQATAKDIGVRLNAVAPTLTPTHMTSEYSKAWLDSGLPANKSRDVAAAITQLSVDSAMEGKCCLVIGEKMLEIEKPRAEMVPAWMGQDVVQLMGKSAAFFKRLGEYPLPPINREIED